MRQRGGKAPADRRGLLWNHSAGTSETSRRPPVSSCVVAGLLFQDSNRSLTWCPDLCWRQSSVRPCPDHLLSLKVAAHRRQLSCCSLFAVMQPCDSTDDQDPKSESAEPQDAQTDGDSRLFLEEEELKAVRSQGPPPPSPSPLLRSSSGLRTSPHRSASPYAPLASVLVLVSLLCCHMFGCELESSSTRSENLQELVSSKMTEGSQKMTCDNYENVFRLKQICSLKPKNGSDGSD